MKTHKIYLASPSQKFAEMRELHFRVPELFYDLHSFESPPTKIEIVSRWYFDSKIGYDLSDYELRDAANRDLGDLMKADVYIGFWAKDSPGGMHVELGYALARGYRCFIVGEMSNVFHRLDRVFVGDLNEVCANLGSRRL